jgi:cobaltochelatase CobS
MRRPVPPTTTTVPPGRIARMEWTPWSLPGIDVRLYRAEYFDADNHPVLPDGIPPVDPSYQFREDIVREFAWATWPHDSTLGKSDWTPMLLSGPRGSGKTSFVTQMAARCNVPVYRVNCNAGTTVRHLKGRVGAVEGRTVYVPGAATLAMEAPAAWLLLDEVTGLVPQVALTLFPIMEPHGDVLLEDAQPPRYVRRSPHFRMYLTDNTLGYQQEDSRYDFSGTNADINVALLDRIGAFSHVPYLSPTDEHQTIASMVPTIDGCDLEGIVRVANECRRSADIVSGGFSMRMVLGWARRVAAGRVRADGSTVPWDRTTDTYMLTTATSAFLSRMTSRTERDAVVEVITRVFPNVIGG